MGKVKQGLLWCFKSLIYTLFLNLGLWTIGSHEDAISGM